MRADRLLSILLLLQVHRRITASELAKRLEVSERTIYRDMEALGNAGIPVVAERGTGGGWQLLEPYRTNLTGLNETEIFTLSLSPPSDLLSDLGLHHASESVFIKLLAALPSMHRRDAEFARQRIYIDTAGWFDAKDTVPLLIPLQEAIWQERKLHLTYQRGDDVIVERVVDPLGLVAKGSGWYFVAAVDSSPRTYRVSRVRGVCMLQEPCIRPQDFDLAAYWKASMSSFRANLPSYPVFVRVSPEGLQQIYRIGRVRFEQQGEADEDGYVWLCLLFEFPNEAASYLLSLSTRVEIIEPLDVREMIVQIAERALAYYKQPVQ